MGRRVRQLVLGVRSAVTGRLSVWWLDWRVVALSDGRAGLVRSWAGSWWCRCGMPVCVLYRARGISAAADGGTARAGGVFLPAVRLRFAVSTAPSWLPLTHTRPLSTSSSLSARLVTQSRREWRSANTPLERAVLAGPARAFFVSALLPSVGWLHTDGALTRRMLPYTCPL